MPGWPWAAAELGFKQSGHWGSGCVCGDRPQGTTCSPSDGSAGPEQPHPVWVPPSVLPHVAQDAVLSLAPLFLETGVGGGGQPERQARGT